MIARIDSTLKKYILTNWESEPVTRLPKGAPEWARKAKAEGGLETLVLKGRAFNALGQDVEHAIGYLRTFDGAKNLNVSYLDAVTQGSLLIEKNNRDASSAEGRIETLYKFDDGYKIVTCLDAQALKREGKIMQHCVGDEGQNYNEDVAEGSLQIWSLRDKNNEPHCTVEYSVRNKRIKQIKGKQNKGVVAKYTPYLKEWFESGAAKNLIDDFDSDDLINIGVIEQDGIWYDMYKLPENFVIKGDLDLTDSEIPLLPDNLTIIGSLTLIDSALIALPSNLTVGTLYLGGSQITTLTEGLNITKSLSGLDKIKIIEQNVTIMGPRVKKDWPTTRAKIGPNFVMKGNLILLPGATMSSGFKVTGILDMTTTSIKKLPSRLVVEDELQLNEYITLIPEDAKIKKVIKFGENRTRRNVKIARPKGKR